MSPNALKILSLGWRNNDARIEFSSYGSTSSLLDYDAVVWRPHDLLADYFSGTTTFKGLSCLSDDQSFRLRRDVDRRKREMQRLVELGKTLVMFLPPKVEWFAATGEKQYSGTGKNRATTRVVDGYSIESTIPAPLRIVGSTGESIDLVASGPFAEFWREAGDLMYYSGYLEESAGETLAVVAGTNLPVASLIEVGSGQILVLPDPTFEEPWGKFEASDYPKEDVASARKEFRERDKEESRFTNALIELVGSLRVKSGDFSLPEWGNEILLPSEPRMSDELSKVEARVGRALREQDLKSSNLQALVQRKLLFCGNGVALESMVQNAFEGLGFSVEQGANGRADCVLKLGRKQAIVEVKGKSRSAAESDAAQLEKWVAEAILEGVPSPKGILVVNAWRGKPLIKRTDPAFPEQMIPFSASRGHCLITGLQLLGAWLDAEAYPSKKKAIAKSILDCDGVFPDYQDWKAFTTFAETSESSD